MSFIKGQGFVHDAGGSGSLTPESLVTTAQAMDGTQEADFRTAVAAVGTSQLSTTGGANKVLQLDASGNLTTGSFSNAGIAFDSPGNIQIPDQQGLIWLKKDGTRSGATVRHWQDHDNDGGELIIDSPWRIALIPHGLIQIGKNDSGRYPRKMVMVSGYASNANAAVNYMPSGAFSLQTSAWNGTVPVFNEIIAQAHALDTSGTNSILRIWDQATVNGENDQASVFTSGRGDVSGNLIAEIYKDGIWSKGTAPIFQLLTDGATITYTCSKFKSSQNAEVTIAGNRTLVINGLEDGMRGVIFVTQDGVGSRTLTPSGGAALDLSTTANARDRVMWEYDGVFLNFSVTKNVQVELPPLDSDASAFILAASITSPTQKVAISNLVTSLKSASLWAKFYGIYPFVGGTSTAHAQDLKAAYDISWTGSVTHNANGVTGDGSSAYGNTGINLSTLGATNSASAYIYCKSSSVTSGAYFCGATAAGGGRFGMSESGGLMLMQGVNDGTASTNYTASGDFRRHWIVNRSASNAKQIYRDGTVVNASDASTSAPNLPIFVLARNSAGSPGNYINANLGFAAFGQSLSESEWTTFRGIVDAFQTALGRANP